MSLQVISKVNRLRSIRDKKRQAIEQNKIENTKFNPYGVPEDFKEFAAICQIRSGLEFIPFNLFDYQEEISHLYDRCKGLAVLKTRQTGFSELTACKMLHRSLLNPAYLGVAFSLGQNESSKLSDRVGLMPSQIPSFRWITDSKTARKSEKGGELLFRPSTPNAARSLASLTDIFLDECGFPAEIEEMYGNATPAQSMVGEQARRILGTTIPPDGLQCWFGRTFWSNLNFDLEEELALVQEGRGRNGRGFSYWIDDDGWARILLHWQSHPIYSSIPNYLEKIKSEERITEEQLQREHNLGIPKEGGSLFNLEAIASSAIGQWAKPHPGHRYFSMLDPNMGGDDSWTLLTWNITTHPFSLVHEYAISQRSPNLCFLESLEVIKQYKPVLLAVEKNNGGLKIAEDFANRVPWLQVEVVNTSAMSKQVNTDRIAIALVSGDVIYPEDWLGIDEMKKFSAQKREAISGHDDRVMSWAIGWSHLETALALRPAKVEFKSTGKRVSHSIGY